MKNRKFKICFSIAMALGLVSCGNESLSSSFSSESSLKEENSSSSSEEIVTVKDLSEAIENTSSYSLNYISLDGTEYPYEIYTDDFFYYRPYSEGYILLDSDPNFYHSFTTASRNGSYSEFDIDVHGRNYHKKDRLSCFYIDFLDILRDYADKFTLSEDRTYTCTKSTLADELKNYFQSRAYLYTNYYEIKVGNNGRLSSFKAYEKDGSTLTERGSYVFRKFDKESFDPYARWKESGSKINLRIFDLKTGYQERLAYKHCYEDSNVEISGIVTTYDLDGNYYIANEDNANGYVGIKVKPNKDSKIPTITDTIKVKGILKGDGYNVYIDNATFEKESESTYFPYFDEESIHSMYGGGYYAAYMFSQTPYYSGSLYSTYGYVEEMPTKVEEDKDTIVTIAFPKFTYTTGGYMKMGLCLPSSLEVTKREEILASLKEFGTYSSKDNTAEEINFDKFIVDFDTSYDYIVKLVYGSSSNISKSLSPKEKVEKDYGISNFPFPSSESFGCYHFGGSSGMYLESVYGKDGKDTLGIYYYTQDLSESDITNEKNGLISLGFSLSDVIKDSSRRRHYIYKKDSLIVDLLEEKSTFGGTLNLHMWIYKGNLVYQNNILEILKEKVPFFDTNDFVFADNTTSADYTYYGLPNFAGRKYQEGSYLTCITVDLTEDGFTNIRKKYREEKGYKIYRDSDGKQYTYRTRGQNHYVYYKDIEGSEEKVFVDMALYPTSDYTFLNHNNFSYRLEVLIYKGKEPLSTLYETNLDSFFERFNELNGVKSGIPSFSLPTDTKIEIVDCFDREDMAQYDYTYYGYFMDLQCFLYTSNLNDAYNSLVTGLKNAGYTYYSTSPKGNECYYLEGENPNEDYGSFILLMKGSNYIRILEGIGGIDF